MSALFSRSSNSLFALVVAGLGATLVGTPVLLMIWVRTPYVTGQQRELEQPIAFDHRHHVADDGIDCAYCHDLAWRSSFAGVPPTERCLNCHSQIWNDSSALSPLWRSVTSGGPIPWVRVHRLPDFVYFNHAIHVNKGVACETCHGRVDRMARISQAAPLTMGWCLDCHRNPAPHLRPRDEVTAMGWHAKRGQPSGTELARRYHVESLTDCTTCHR